MSFFSLLLLFLLIVPIGTSMPSYGRLNTPSRGDYPPLSQLTEVELQFEYDRLDKEYTNRLVETLVGEPWTPPDSLNNGIQSLKHYEIHRMSMVQMDEEMESIRWHLALKSMEKETRLWTRVDSPYDGLDHCARRGFLSAEEAETDMKNRFDLRVSLPPFWCFGNKTLQPACALKPGQQLPMCTKECPTGLSKVVFKDDGSLSPSIPDMPVEFCCPKSESEIPGYNCRHETACALAISTPVLLERGFAPRVPCATTNLYPGVIAHAYPIVQRSQLKQTFITLCGDEPDCHRVAFYVSDAESTFAVYFFRVGDFVPIFPRASMDMHFIKYDNHYIPVGPYATIPEIFLVKDEPHPGRCSIWLAWDDEEQRCLSTLDLSAKNKQLAEFLTANLKPYASAVDQLNELLQSKKEQDDMERLEKI